MKKREKLFKDLCDKHGLKIIEWTRHATRVGGLVEAPNGKRSRMTIPASETHSDRHGDMNAQAELRKFAQQNPATALSAALAQVVPSITPPKPIVLKRNDMGAKPFDVIAQEVLTMLVLETDAATSAAPAPVAAPTPPAIEQQTPKEEKPVTTTSLTNKNKLGQVKFFHLATWLKDADISTAKTYAEGCALAEKALGFPVPLSSFQDACGAAKITKFNRPIPKGTDSAAIKVLASALGGLLKDLGHDVPADLAALMGSRA